MAGSNFPNGSLVMRIWQFDGSGEMVAKCQYFNDALTFCELLAKKIGAEQPYFYLAVCDEENKFKCFFRPKEAA